jgi:hypothetical protein
MVDQGLRFPEAIALSIQSETPPPGGFAAMSDRSKKPVSAAISFAV